MVMEDGGVPYVDVLRDEQLPPERMRERCSAFSATPERLERARPFAPPFIELPDGAVLSQMANLMLFVASRCDLAPKDDAGKSALMSLLMTIADAVAEAHDTHHPVSSGLFYEDQKAEAARKSAEFTSRRLSQYLCHFDETLRANGGDYLMGAHCSAADIGVVQLALGLEFAFPKAYARASATTPGLVALIERVQRRPRLAAYMQSARRTPFNGNGVFRHYEELDQ
jgi:glutathione S-transferase